MAAFFKRDFELLPPDWFATPVLGITKAGWKRAMESFERNWPRTREARRRLADARLKLPDGHRFRFLADGSD